MKIRYAARLGLLALFCVIALGPVLAVSPAESKPKTKAESKSGPKAKTKELGTLSIQIENDLFGSGDDRHYTNGVRLAWLSAENDIPDWVRNAASLHPILCGQREITDQL